MTQRIRLTLIAAAGLAVLSQSAAYAQEQAGRGPDANVRAAIEAANKKYFIDAAPKGDAALVAMAYTDDAVAYPANSEAVRGRAALQALWKGAFDAGITGFDLKTEEVEAAGDTAWETGTYLMKLKDGTVADRGKYVVIWKRVRGDWKIHRDIWTTSLPAAK
jgi:ketosteroid isomerase-like protein